jgi:DNA-binding GntR family transcriptional regulator
MKNRKTDDEISRELGELYYTIGLKTVRAGTDLKNFKILKMLPSNIENMMKELHLTKVPVNNRVNLLEEVDLIRRLRGTGDVVITDFGKFFLDKIRTYEDVVRDHVVSIIKNHVE